jgi:hypothetical protein
MLASGQRAFNNVCEDFYRLAWLLNHGQRRTVYLFKGMGVVGTVHYDQETYRAQPLCQRRNAAFHCLYIFAKAHDHDIRLLNLPAGADCV